MAVDTWNDQELSFHERAATAARSVVIALFWMTLVAGPPVVGGVLGWMATRDAGRGPLSGLLGQLPADQMGVTITRGAIAANVTSPTHIEESEMVYTREPRATIRAQEAAPAKTLADHIVL
ncbi:hypothetical protein [Thalassobaculum salexigens]|uniref:hypothetical protein n=1 Tax=Thalassobaculum salexigens TaxID=455360 RepID=UPI00248EAE59|nr:hypothetical protein [Thalassobaculum salexigens]